MTGPASIVDRASYDRAVAHFSGRRIALPTFGQLADPLALPTSTQRALADVDPDAADPRNLFRVHWHNDADRRGVVEVPVHLELPPALTGVPARIVVALGECFPMITAHKVLAAYGCLAPRIVTGEFDPTRQKALWPSTGNYCRGGVAISRIMGCRGVAILPEGMSAERFAWLDRWVADPADVVRTPGSESNVKEIYDKCAELDRDEQNVVFNQFREFGNHLVHYLCTGAAIGRVYESLRRGAPALQLRAFVSATGSAGTLAAGDALHERYGAMTIAVEAAECPTMLHNGYGEHNIQGIGDKHLPLIHNVMNTDVVVAVSDASTDSLHLLFNTEVGRRHLVERRGVDAAVVERLGSLGLSGICNVLAAIRFAKHHDLGADDLVATVATDGAALYATEQPRIETRRFGGRFDAITAAEVTGQHLLGGGEGELRELTRDDRSRIFNLGYFTWVEQQGVSLADFEARRQPSFWRRLRDQLPAWDAAIAEFNAHTGVETGR